MSTDIKLPKDWKKIPLGEVCKLKNGFAFKSTHYKADGVPVIRISDIKDGFIVPKNTVRVSEKIDYDRYIIKIDDILVAMSGATTGKFGIFKAMEVAYQNQRVGKFDILNKKILDNNFLLYQLHALKRQIEKNAYGGAQPNISSKKIEEMEIVLPPLQTQQVIVSKIEELFSELDKGLECLKTAQQQLKTYRQSVLKWAFEGKLTNKNVKDDELPKGWKTTLITEIVEKNKHALKAGPFGSSLKKEFYVQKGYKVYGQEQVISGDPFFGNYFIDREKYEDLKTCQIKPNDILISLVGTVGKVLLLPENCEPGIINPRLIKISLDRKIYFPNFFKYYFESSVVKMFYSNVTKGTTMDVLNLGIIKTIPFPLPSIKEQQQIVKEIESRLSVADNMEESINQSLQQAEALRQSILKKAFEGELI